MTLKTIKNTPPPSAAHPQLLSITRNSLILDVCPFLNPLGQVASLTPLTEASPNAVLVTPDDNGQLTSFDLSLFYILAVKPEIAFDKKAISATGDRSIRRTRQTPKSFPGWRADVIVPFTLRMFR
jgi:hypothetical protein